MTQYALLIDGRRTEAASGRRYDSVDPYLRGGRRAGRLRLGEPRTVRP